MTFINQKATFLPEFFWAALSITGLGWSVLVLVSVMSRKSTGAQLVILAFFLGSAITHVLKPFISSPRPGAIISNELLHFIGDPVISHQSMPSGHSVAAFCMASLWIFLARIHKTPQWVEWAAWITAALIATSRIAVGAHWPADVLVGSGLGVIVGLLTWRLYFVFQLNEILASPWWAVGVETLGAFAAMTFEEGLPMALIWQRAIGFIAIASVACRVHSACTQSTKNVL